MSRSVATPFGAQRLACESEEVKPKEEDKLPPSRAFRVAAESAALVPAAVVKKTKLGGKRTSAKVQSSAEDTGRFHPHPAKRCKLLDEGGEEPSEEMRSMEAAVVNLTRRPDRMDGCSARILANCPWLKHTRYHATDGKVDPPSLDEVVISWNTASNVVYQKKRAIRKGWNDLDTYQVRQLELSPGERGCAMSHIRLWRSCLEQAGDTERPLLVLEDDAAPTPEFTSRLRRALAALPSDANLLYLGYSQAADWKREVTENLAEVEYVWTTVGYIIWPSAARLFLSRLPVDGPVDNWMAGYCASGDIRAYAVRPKIVLQAEPWNVNSDVGHSDEHYWGPNSDIHHSDYLYGPPYNAETSEAAPNGASGRSSLADRSNSIWANIDEASEESEDSDGGAC